MLRRSIRFPCAASASAMSSAVTEPYNFSCSPTLRAIFSWTLSSWPASACAESLSFAWRAAITLRSCSSWRTFFSLASTASLRGKRKLRPKPSLTVTISPDLPRFWTSSRKMTFTRPPILAGDHHVWDQRQSARALDRHRYLALVLGAVPGNPPRDDLPALGDEVLERGLIFV